MKLSVLMILDQMNVGGTETHVLSVVTALRQRGIHVVVVAASGPLQAQFSQLGIRLYELRFDGIQTSPPSLIEQLSQICRQENITTLHAHQTPSARIAVDVSELLQIPLIFTVHGTYYDPHELASVLRRTNSIIAVSEPVQAHIETIGFSAKVIPNGIDPNAFYPIEGNYKRHELGIPDDALIILNAGRLAWEKAKIAKMTIQVALGIELEFRHFPIHAMIAGDGPAFASINRHSTMLNSWRRHEFIHLLGNTHQLLQYYAVADLVIGTGRVALEAMCCGKPVIAVGTHGHFGLVTPGNFVEACKVYFGDHGSVEPASRSALTREVRDALRDRPRLAQIGLACRTQVQEAFSLDNTCEELIREYERHV